MLLTLRILTYRGAPVPAAPAARFDAAGGNIGRSSDNLLVLDDPSKYISRVHAHVSVQDGAFVLEDMGANASVVNDRPLGKGARVALAHGDRLVIGEYVLQAAVQTMLLQPALAPAPVNDPTLPLFEPPPPPPPVQLPPLDFAAPAATASSPAPAMHGSADLLAGSSLLDVVPGQAGGIGGDDPLGLNLFAPPLPGRAAESDHVSPELAAFPGSRAVPPPAFGTPPVQVPPAFGVPQAAAPMPSAGAFAIPADYDPLADFYGAPAVPVPPTAPPVTPPVAAAALGDSPAAPPPVAVPATPATPASAVPAPFETPPMADSDQTTFAFAPPATPSASPFVPPAPVPPQAPAQSPALSPAPAAASAETGPAPDDAVLQALLRGLGLPGLQIQRPATEVAELVGALLREATAGTMDVLMARALTKKESRIEMTMLSLRANNPLKFFPHAEGALTQMLTGAMGGYMPPVEAMAGAFDDLRAHELAVIAGMRAALAAVLHRFDPDKIEARLAVPTVMDKMLASNRKAKLWDRLVELYGEIAREADDDLQRLFGEKFSAAYEEQVERLRLAKQAAGQ